MTPISTLDRGDYRLRYPVTNPAGCSRADDWRQKDVLPAGTKFHCFDVYCDGRLLPTLYIDRPGLMVHESCMPEVFHLLLPNLERV